jgi:hypothetical protein
MDSAIKNGDILWFSRYTMIIDSETNSIIESGGYDPGFFGLRITPIYDRIIGVNNTEDLGRKLKNGEPLELVDYNGNAKQVSEWDILSLIPYGSL